MDERNRAMIVFFLLCVIAEMPAEGQNLGVCATCHANAMCDDKPDGSGKVCNCKYGFVGNGRTYCQDKDECQIGATKICGQHTTCHNTYGSYYCTCLPGYSPSNNMTVFIPNDGTHCQDIDECRITGLCGEGGLCRNLDGSFECSCQLGYEVHNGVGPFNPHRDKASCKVVDCGQPASVEDTVLLSFTGTTYDSVAMFACDEGFVWRIGDNSSVCGANGLWRGPSMVCEEVDCGSPPTLPHSHMLWNKSTRMGSKVLYQCNTGYHNVGKGNVSICNAGGQWERPPVLCQETLCGSPPIIESTEQVWDSDPTPGSTVLYVCKKGFYNKGGHNVSICNANGQWTPPTLSCQEILCGDPPLLPHTGQVWNGSSTPGSTVTYYCKLGFDHNRGNNMSLCTINGYWTKPKISCKEVDCGVPPPIPHSVMLWDKISTVGSQVIYQCNSGYGSVGGRNVSVCIASGEWDGASLLCQEINCQEPVFKPHAKMLWDGTSHIGSLVYYQCEEGYYTKSLRNYSSCGENGLWEDIDLWCEEISCGPPLTLPRANLLWDGTSRLGSVVLYECMDGFYQESGNNISTCLQSGQWGKVSVKCKDIDECRITGLCGEGGLCRNLDGSFECSCQLGYEVHNGVGPFNPHRDKASCKVVDCGQPASVEDTVLLSFTGTTYDSVAMFACDEGFVWRSGDNSSVCGANGLWRGPSMVCEEVDCGSPPTLPHSHMLWNKSTRMGSKVLYQCNTGYHNVGKGNVSICNAGGQWERPPVLCQETLCGSPPIIESTEQVWDSDPTPGSTVLYVCKKGFYNKGGHNVSICNANGQWTPPTLSCQEILCGDPPLLPHTGQVWNGSSTPGSTVTYYCKLGFDHNRGNNMSLCTINGYWTKPKISCKEVDCGVPPPIPHSVMLWDKISTVGSQVIYQCNSGYGSVGGRNVSVCIASGEWDGASLLCQEINCQEPVFKPHAKMLWDGTSHIGSLVYYQCEEGYYTKSLRNYSSCGENGLWEDIDLWCEGAMFDDRYMD